MAYRASHIFRVKYQHTEVLTVFANSFDGAFRKAKTCRSLSGIREIRLASKHEIRRFFGGRSRVPKKYQNSAAVGQEAL